MNRYIKLFKIVFLLTCFSFFIEYLFPCTFVNDLKNANIIGLFILRYVHFFIFLYFSFFLYFFNCKNKYLNVYIFLSCIILIQWLMFGYCVVSYYELKAYKVNPNDYSLNFHPCIFVFARENLLLILFIKIMFILTLFMIIFKCKPIYKIILLSLFFVRLMCINKPYPVSF